MGGPESEQKEKSKLPELPGNEYEMALRPKYDASWYKGSGKLSGKVALITGGDSGIGRSVAILYAREGCKGVCIVYLSEDKDAAEAKAMVEKEGSQCLLIRGDIGDQEFCKSCVRQTVSKWGALNILVNNAAEQHVQDDIRGITKDQLVRTFSTNLFSMFFLVQAALDVMKKDDCIINSTSVTAYHGKANLLDYSSSKGAITAFTRSLSENLSEKGIRVNAVAPGPVWTPLVAGSFDKETLAKFGEKTALGRAGQPEDIAPSYVFLAANDGAYFTGQVLHPNGGSIVNA
eukprot:ANDGO_02756.mRNA.1 putative oxidoreductase YhxC